MVRLVQLSSLLVIEFRLRMCRFGRTGKRDDIFLATKFGFGGKDSTRPFGINGTPKYVSEAIDQSLGRLGVDHIDLWYLHR